MNYALGAIAATGIVVGLILLYVYAHSDKYRS